MQQQQITQNANSAAIAGAGTDIQARLDREFAQIAGLLTPAAPTSPAKRDAEDASRVTSMRALILGRARKRAARLN